MDRYAFPRAAVRAAALSGLCAVSLCGCATLPSATPARQAKAPAAYQSQASLSAPAADWPSDGWWKAYGDPQLDALIDEAIKDSPSLAQAEARLRKARAMRTVAAADTLPSLSGAANVQELKQSYEYLFPKQFVPQGYQDYAQATLNLNWQLDFWGKNRAAVAAAASEARAAAADAAEARLILTTDIADAYATLARLLADRAVASEAARVRQQTVGLTAQRVTNGVDTQAELEQAQGALPAALATVAALDEEIAQTRDALAALAGAGPDRGLALTAPNAMRLKTFGLPADVRLNLIGRRPDVIAARWRAEAADRRVYQAKAAFYPDINIAAYIGQQSLHVENLVSPGAAIGGVTPALSLPIFQGWRLRGALRGAQADRDAAVTQALREVADVAASERALGERLDQSRRALASYEGAYHVARLRYEGGLSSFQSVLLAEDAVLSQRRIVSDLESRAFTLDVALVRALGGGFGPKTETPHA